MVFNQKSFTKSADVLLSGRVWVLFWCLVYSGLAFSANDSMPWDGPLCGLANNLRGPVALAVATIAFFAAGAAMVWGEELTGMVKKLVGIFMAVTILLGGASIVGWIAVKMGAMGATCSS